MVEQTDNKLARCLEKDKLQEIFKLYERSSSLAGGLGVGLSIVKKICDESSIELRVESELGKGSRFILQWSGISIA